jgi:hypothetical protein
MVRLEGIETVTKVAETGDNVAVESVRDVTG